MSKWLFLRLVDEISEYDSYFVQKKDAAGKLGLSAIQKCAAIVQILGYGMTPDALDQYFRNAESTAREALKIVVKAIQGLYKSRYLGNQQEKTYYNKSILTNVGAGQKCLRQ
jgi:hypothetical protein